MIKTILQTIVLTLLSTFCFSNNTLNLNYQNPCDAIISAGIIGHDQVVCEDNNTPIKLEELSAPTGNPDGYEFLWIYTNTNPNAQTIVWYPINSATGKSYQPEPISVTTWFRRCVRPVGCDVYTAESNIIKIDVEDCTIDCSLFTGNISIENEITCYGESNGSIFVELNGGKAPFTYEWSDASFQGDFAENLSEGTYSVVVTDANDCSFEATISLKNPAPFSIEYEMHPETCAGNDGAIYLNMVGGIAPFDILWGNGMGTNQNLVNVPEGFYVVWVTDANGCYAAIELLVTKECDPLIIDFDENGLQTVDDEIVTIQWVSENEQDGGKYLVERSRNNIDFNILCSMNGTGFEINGQEYICRDENPFAGTNFYRIVHVSSEGRTVSESQSVLVEKEGISKVLVYPNPVVHTASVNFLKPLETNTTVQVFNQNGTPIQSVTVESGTTIQPLDLRGMPAGQYMIYVEMNGQKPEMHRIFKGE